MTVAERRDMLSVSLSLPADNALAYEGDLGRRLAGLKLTTRLNAGFETLSARVLSRGHLERLPAAEAVAIFRSWRFCILRVCLGGELVWDGHVWRLQLGEWVDDPVVGLSCAVELQARGRWAELTNTPASVDDEYTDDGASVSATQLALDLLDNSGDLTFDRSKSTMIAQTGINIGPVGVGLQDYPLDLLLNALRAGNGRGEEFYLALWEPEDGLWIQPRDAGWPRWRLPMVGGPGLVWDGEEYADEVRALYTDDAGTNLSTDGQGSDAATLAHNGVHRERVISIDKVGQDGAETAARTFLANHGDPIGFQGSYRVQPRDGLVALVPNHEGRLEPGYRVRAGQRAELPDAIRFDPGLGDLTRIWPIESTSYDVDAGTLELQLDQRKLRSRLAEKPAEVTHILQATEPGASKKIWIELEETAGVTFTRNSDVELSAVGLMPHILAEFVSVRKTKISITVHIEIDGTTANDDQCWAGYTLDGETWDSSDNTMAIGTYARADEDNAKILEATWKRTIRPGSHTIRTWVRVNAASNYTANVGRLLVKG